MTMQPIKQLIKVTVNRDVPLEKVPVWTKHIADEVFRSIPDHDDDFEVVVTLDFSDNPELRRSVKKMIMDSLEEELLR